MPPIRLRALLASAVLVGLPLLGAAGTGTAVAEGSPSPSSSPSTLVTLPPVSPTPRPSATPTARRTSTPRPTVSPTPRRTRSPRPVVSAKPRVASTAPTGSTASPVTNVDVGTVGRPTPSPTKVTAKPAASQSDSARLAKLAALVVGAAVLLGLGGMAGLYLTRHREG